MNWKKWLLYLSIGLIGLTSFVIYYVNDSLTRVMGAYTKVVDINQFKPATGPVAIKNINVLAPNGEKFLANQTVLVDQGIIQAIDTTLAIPSQVTSINGRGKYLIPGLIDSHMHLFKSPNDLLLYLANGVTEIREMVGNEERLQQRQQIEDGRIGPKIWVASPLLGTADNLGLWFLTKTRGGINVQNAEAATTIVQELFDNEYDGIKIYSHLSKESYLAITQKAKELGMPVVGHIPWSVSLLEVWKNGQSEIAHLEEIMNALRREYGYIKNEEVDKFLLFIRERSETIAKNMLEQDIAITSTLWLTESFVRQKFELDEVLREIPLAYMNPGIVEGAKLGSTSFGWLPETNFYQLPKGLTEEEKAERKIFWEMYGQACRILAKELANQGVKIFAGTDTNFSGFALHSELESLEKAGLSTAQVLRAATSAPATFMKSNSGKIAIGFKANLIVLDKNPLEDIKNTRTINTVFANGKIYDRNLLDKMLSAVKAANDESRKIDISQYE